MQVLTTEPGTMVLVTVDSAQAQAATSGQWSSRVGLGAAAIDEVPPDAKISLFFSDEVDKSMLQASLVMLRPPGYPPSPDPKLTVESCAPDWRGAEGTRCVVKPNTALNPGAPYKLALPAGAKVSRASGAATKAVMIPLAGLSPFVVRFDGVDAKTELTGRRLNDIHDIYDTVHVV